MKKIFVVFFLFIGILVWGERPTEWRIFAKNMTDEPFEMAVECGGGIGINGYTRGEMNLLETNPNLVLQPGEEIDVHKWIEDTVGDHWDYRDNLFRIGLSFSRKFTKEDYLFYRDDSRRIVDKCDINYSTSTRDVDFWYVDYTRDTPFDTAVVLYKQTDGELCFAYVNGWDPKRKWYRTIDEIQEAVDELRSFTLEQLQAIPLSESKN